MGGSWETTAVSVEKREPCHPLHSGQENLDRPRPTYRCVCVYVRVHCVKKIGGVQGSTSGNRSLRLLATYFPTKTLNQTTTSSLQFSLFCFFFSGFISSCFCHLIGSPISKPEFFKKRDYICTKIPTLYRFIIGLLHWSAMPLICLAQPNSANGECRISCNTWFVRQQAKKIISEQAPSKNQKRKQTIKKGCAVGPQQRKSPPINVVWSHFIQKEHSFSVERWTTSY